MMTAELIVLVIIACLLAWERWENSPALYRFRKRATRYVARKRGEDDRAKTT